jgi:O-antigen/teichoic acid export membrane protein
MLNRILSSSLFRASGIYTISSFFNAAIPLLLLPILTNRLTPEDYGIIAMFQLIVSVIYPIIGLNLESSISRKYYEKDNSDFHSYVGTCIILVALNLLISTLILLPFVETISNITHVPEIWIKYSIIVSICQFLTTVLLTTYQIRIKPLNYGVYQIIQSLVNISLTVFFVVFLSHTWKGRLNAQLYTGIFFALTSVILLIYTKQISINVKIKDITHALKFGVPLIPHVLGGLLFTAIDRFCLTSIVGLEQTGNYSVAYQLGAVINLITISFNNAYTPWLYGELNKNCTEIKKKIVKFTYLYFVIISFLAILVITFFPIIVNIFVGKKFSSINSYSTFIVLGFVFQGMYYMVTNYIGYANKTYLLAIITISLGILKLPITYFLIKLLGSIGASVSYCITFFLFFIATWILSAKVYKMPWFSFKQKVI